MMAMLFFNTQKKSFKLHAQPQTGAYSCDIVIVLIDQTAFRYHRLEQFLCWGPYQRYAMFFMEWMSGIELKVHNI